MSRPLRIEFPGAIYRSLLDTLRCLANEVVVGLMAVTLERQAATTEPARRGAD